MPTKTFELNLGDILFGGSSVLYTSPKYLNPDDIKRVHFDEANRATIVFWEDGTKTVVVAQDGDEYNKELGLAMAILKHYYKNAKEFNGVFRKWIPEMFK